MAGALGAGLGLLFGAGIGHLQAKRQQEMMAKKAEGDLLAGIVGKNPEVMNSPEFQKIFKKFYGDEGVQMIGGLNQMRQQAMATVQQQGLLPGAAPQTGGVAGHSANSVIAEPRTVEQLQEWIGHYESNPDLIAQLPDRVQKSLEERYKRYNETLKELEKEQRAPEVEKQKELAKYAPDVTQARAGAEAQVGSARARAEEPIRIATARGEADARLAVESSDKAIRAAADKVFAETQARRKATGEAPLTLREKSELKNQLETRTKSLITNYKTVYGDKPYLLGRDKWTADFKHYVSTQDPEVAAHLFNVPVGSIYGTSASKGPGWKTPDGSFIPDSD